MRLNYNSYVYITILYFERKTIALLSDNFHFNWKGKVVARSYLYQTAVPSAETEVTFSVKDGKIRKAAYGQSSATTQVTLLPQSTNKILDEDSNQASGGSYNLKYGDKGTFQTTLKKENGNNNNGNGIHFGGNAYAKEQISPMSPVLTKTPLPVIGGK